jgi:hypothetical protein
MATGSPAFLLLMMLYMANKETMPDSLRKNAAHNTLFALPLIFGLIGLFYQFKKNKGDAIAATLLFYCSGLAIIIYINQSGMQPRERDYAYAGSFYAFAIWIGLAVLYFIDLALKWDKTLVKNILIKGGIFSALLSFALYECRLRWSGKPGRGYWNFYCVCFGRGRIAIRC